MKNVSDIAAEIAAYRSGYSLPAVFYRDASVFDQDVRAIVLRSWFYVCHESELPDTGSFQVLELAGESIIVVRTADGELRAHLNVCRHRGSRVCWEKSGQLRNFVCPYHGWAYNLEGDLLNNREMGHDFDKTAFGLKSIGVTTFNGFVFVNFVLVRSS